MRERSAIAKRGGWYRLALLAAVLIAIIVGLSVGLTIGLRSRKYDIISFFPSLNRITGQFFFFGLFSPDPSRRSLFVLTFPLAK